MCPYAYVNEHDRRLKCKLQSVDGSNRYCGYQRFCNTQQEWVNTYKMSRCVIRKDKIMEDSKNENISKSNIEKKTVVETQSSIEQPIKEEKIVLNTEDNKNDKEVQIAKSNEEENVKSDSKKVNKKDKKDYVKNQSTDEKQKTKVCKKKFFSKGKLYFTFDNFDLEIPMSYESSKKNEFTVTYVGEIGKAGFKIISVK